MSNDTTCTDAVPSDPFVRLRYQYGMLLGAEDFTVEQREKVLRRRLHQALLHGAGTVSGLRVDAGSPDPNNNQNTQLIVQPGLAVDLLGRDVYVDQKQCLDVSGLLQNPVWPELEAITPTTWAAYVLLRYDSCLSDPVPAIAPPCNAPGSAITYSRCLDRFRIDLAAKPPDPSPFARSFLDALAKSKPDAPRRALLDFLLDPTQPPLQNLWTGPVPDVPLLLAKVTLSAQIVNNAPTGLVFVVGDPDNAVRWLLPPVQAVAESLFGQQLLGSAEPALYFQVSSWKVDSATQITIDLTQEVNASTASATAGTIVVRRLDPTGWTPPVTPTKVDTSTAKKLVLTLPAPPGSPTTVTYQVFLAGETAAPLLSSGGAPLAGVVGDPLTHPRRGRDAGIIGTWPST